MEIFSITSWILYHMTASHIYHHLRKQVRSEARDVKLEERVTARLQRENKK
jgi:hypothetical protein